MQQVCIPVGCVPPASVPTGGSLFRGSLSGSLCIGGSLSGIFVQGSLSGGSLSRQVSVQGISVQRETPGHRQPPLDKDPSLQRNMGPGTQAPKGTWVQAARQEITSYRDPPVDRMTDTCKLYLAPNLVCGRL